MFLLIRVELQWSNVVCFSACDMHDCFSFPLLILLTSTSISLDKLIKLFHWVFSILRNLWIYLSVIFQCFKIKSPCIYSAFFSFTPTGFSISYVQSWMFLFFCLFFYNKSLSNINAYWRLFSIYISIIQLRICVHSRIEKQCAIRKPYRNCGLYKKNKVSHLPNLVLIYNENCPLYKRQYDNKEIGTKMQVGIHITKCSTAYSLWRCAMYNVLDYDKMMPPIWFLQSAAKSHRNFLKKIIGLH